MRWSNKIMSNNQEQSQSKLSSRSLSKFKKVNLQKSEAEILSNEQLEKSVLKLASVQKIKTKNLNQSFISNYVATAQPQSIGSSQLLTQNKRIETEKSKQVIQNSQFFKSGQIQYPKILDFGSQSKDGFKQGHGIFNKEVNSTTNQQRMKDSNFQMENPYNITLEQKLKRVLIKIQQAMAQFKEVSQSIRKSMNEKISSGFIKLQNELVICSRNFEQNFQSGIQQIIKTLTQDTKSPHLRTENLVNTNQILPPSPSNGSSCNIANFQQQQIENERQKQPLTSRANKFKNQFKQIIDVSNNQNFLTKNQVQSGNHQKSGKKLIRKQTNPVNRANLMAKNDLSGINDDNKSNPNDKSMGSIRYSRINERSASKSVQKLHEKLVLIKNIFNGARNDSSSVKNQQVKILVQNNS